MDPTTKDTKKIKIASRNLAYTSAMSNEQRKPQVDFRIGNQMQKGLRYTQKSEAMNISEKNDYDFVRTNPVRIKNELSQCTSQQFRVID